MVPTNGVVVTQDYVRKTEVKKQEGSFDLSV